MTALDFIHILQQWVSSGPSINIKALILSVKSSCQVLITSLREEECDSTSTDSVTDEFTSTAINFIRITTISLVCVTILTLVIVIAVMCMLE